MVHQEVHSILGPRATPTTYTVMVYADSAQEW